MASCVNENYGNLDGVLEEINRRCIALNDEEKKINNMILKEVLEKILQKMRKNLLFDRLFQDRYFGGSFYDNLKVSKPNEYDLDILLRLPKYARPVVSSTEIPGYVRIELENIRNFEKTKNADEYPNLAKKLFDDGTNYLSTSKVLKWMESVLQKALNEFKPISNCADVKEIETSQKPFYACLDNELLYVSEFRKQGPAFTLQVKGVHEGKEIEMAIDLVPCFVFFNEKLPDLYRKNTNHTLAERFFVVPKRPYKVKQDCCPRYWRLSFQEQEGVLIEGENKHRLKPAIRLLKRLRDSCGHSSIASYYIKTIFLWEVLEVEEAGTYFWHTETLSRVFTMMLKKYQKHLQDGDIPYFWNEHNNLLCHLHYDNMKNAAGRLMRIIRHLETNPTSTDIFHYFDAQPRSEQSAQSESSRSWWEFSFWSWITDLPARRN